MLSDLITQFRQETGRYPTENEKKNLLKDPVLICRVFHTMVENLEKRIEKLEKKKN